jgi:chromosomal replication initiator protein
LRATETSPARRQFARLDTFIVGPQNRVAYTAAEKVAARPGEISPLFLYGPTGCGKTHLLEAVWTQLRRTQRTRVLYLSAEQFTTYFLDALRRGGLPSFRSRCREVDLLAVDDLQFFAGKRATIIELQHTLDALLRQGRQLVLAADRPPASLAELGAEMVARFSGGLVCGIEPAEYATRLEIARRKAAGLNVVVPPDVLELVAREGNGDARQIHGTLHRLEATCLALQQPLTPALAETTLREIRWATQPVIRLTDIERAVCDAFGLEPKSLRAGGKARSVSQPRMLAMWLARKHTRAPFADISQYFGRRSHSTVISAERKVQRWMSDGASIQLGAEACHIRDAIQRVESRLRTGT